MQVILYCLFLLLSIDVATGLDFEPAELDHIEQHYGKTARQRFEAWQRLIHQASAAQDLEKLKRVNDFFNRNTAYVEDSVLWGQEDYWATPSEILARAAGDCEDYSIAKYFTLLESGMEESKLRITYVKAIVLNRTHMVLTYYGTPDETPLVLDNLIPSIQAASQRSDLPPVYGFNGHSLWLAKNKTATAPDSGADRLSLWQALRQRLLKIATIDACGNRKRFFPAVRSRSMRR